MHVAGFQGPKVLDAQVQAGPRHEPRPASFPESITSVHDLSLKAHTTLISAFTCDERAHLDHAAAICTNTEATNSTTGQMDLEMAIMYTSTDNPAVQAVWERGRERTDGVQRSEAVAKRLLGAVCMRRACSYRPDAIHANGAPHVEYGAGNGRDR